MKDTRKSLEATYKKQRGFSTVRDYYRKELADNYVKRNLPLPVDDTHQFNDWLALYQESTMIHGNDDVLSKRKEFLNVVSKLTQMT